MSGDSVFLFAVFAPACGNMVWKGIRVHPREDQGFVPVFLISTSKVPISIYVKVESWKGGAIPDRPQRDRLQPSQMDCRVIRCADSSQ